MTDYVKWQEDAHPWIAEALEGLPALLTMDEVAELLRMTPKSAARLASRGELERARPGVVYRESVRAYLRSQAGASTREKVRTARGGPRVRRNGQDREPSQILVDRGLIRCSEFLGAVHTVTTDFSATDPKPFGAALVLVIPTLRKLAQALLNYEGSLSPQQVGVLLRDLRDVPLGGWALRRVGKRGDERPWKVEGVSLVLPSPGAG